MLRTTIMRNKEYTIMEIDELISKLQSKDVENMKLTRVMQFVFITIILLFTIFFIIFPNTESGVNLRLAGAFCIPGFLILLIFFNCYYQKYKRVNYSDSVKSVLQSAEKRFRFWHPIFFVVFVAILLIGTGVGLIFTPKLSELWSLIIVFGTELVIIMGFSFGFYVGYKQWKIDSKPLWMATKKLLKELNESV